MPHQPAGSPKKEVPSLVAKTSKPKTVFTFDTKSTARFFPAALLPKPDKLWSIIINNKPNELSEALESAVTISLISEYVRQDFNPEYKGENAITLAARLGRSNMLGRLVKADGSTEYKNIHGETALHIAVENQDYLSVIILLRNNADCDEPNAQGLNACMLACNKSALETKGSDKHRVAEQIESVIKKYYKKLCTFVTAAERSQHVKKLLAQGINPTGYLTRVYVK